MNVNYSIYSEYIRSKFLDNVFNYKIKRQRGIENNK